jgi:tRNA pseudouridine13 synthase
MRIKVTPDDFVVEEHIGLQLAAAGPWAIYRLRKSGLTTLQARERIAAQLKLANQRVVFPALKDKEAVATQFFAIPAGYPPTVSGERFDAERVGFCGRPLRGSDVVGNAFRIVLRDLDATHVVQLARSLEACGATGIPNYFDEQRFGSFSSEAGFIGKTILLRDAEGAVRAYLTQPFQGDPREVRAFKERAAALWPAWGEMMQAAPRPSNYRSLLTFLLDHPEDFRRALNLIPQRLLALYLAAYQSYLWNRIAAAFLQTVYAHAAAPLAHVRVVDQDFPVHRGWSPSLEDLRDASIPLLHHRAQVDSPDLAEIVGNVLQAEGLALEDLKARILTKAYLPKGNRPLLVFAEHLRIDEPRADERFAGRVKLTVRFVLARGSYASLLLKIADALASDSRETG